MSRQFEATFIFSENVKNKYDEDMLIKSFMKQRGKLVDILNGGVIALLNSDFDKTHEFYEGIYNSKEYNEFMQKGQQKFADIVNSWTDETKDVFLYIDNDNDIYGKMKSRTGYKIIHMCLLEV